MENQFEEFEETIEQPRIRIWKIELILTLLSVLLFTVYVLFMVPGISFLLILVLPLLSLIFI